MGQKTEQILNVVEVLFEQCHACGFVTFEPRVTKSGQIVAIKTLALGSQAYTSPWLRYAIGALPCGFEHQYNEDSASIRRGAWALSSPNKQHLNRFSWWLDDYLYQLKECRHPAVRKLYPEALCDQLRAVYLDHGIITRWAALLFDKPPINRHSIKDKVNALLPRVIELFSHQQISLQKCHGFVVFSTSGRPLYWDRQAGKWLDTPKLEALKTGLQDRLDMPPAQRELLGPWIVDGIEIDWIPMPATECTGHLLQLVPLKPLELDLRTALTSRQRQIAQLVIMGSTNKEIAAQLELSVDTIKYHIKQLYAHLEVSNRIELTSVLLA